MACRSSRGPDARPPLKPSHAGFVDCRLPTRALPAAKVVPLFPCTAPTQRAAQQPPGVAASAAQLSSLRSVYAMAVSDFRLIGGVRRGGAVGVCRSSAACFLPSVAAFFGSVAAFLAVGAAFFSGRFLVGVGRFSYLCSWFWFFPVVASSSPSVAAFFAAWGWSRVFGWFALAVSRIPVSRSLRPSERVAAACPRFACWLCGHFGLSWFVAWSVAARCAASLGVAVGSGGVAAPGVQLSLFR